MAIERDIINQKEYARQEGIAEGEARGRLEGLAEGRSEIARAMLARGMDVATVAEITGLDESQIKSLQCRYASSFSLNS